MLGQMMEPVSFPEIRENHIEKPWATNGHGNKRPHNIINSLFLQADELEKLNFERFKKYDIVKTATEQNFVPSFFYLKYTKKF